jgi:demethylmenaquinone methyltransferase/2-methoxy-6-polyprenyl-1,4-benzoquinol methylase
LSDQAGPAGKNVFTGIAGRYDRLNSILSLGRDNAWRRSAIKHLPPGTVLDLGAGTGAANELFGDRHVIAVDPEPNMLALNPAADKVVGVGEALPFADSSIDGVFSAFVFRNLTSVPDTLDEIARVLRPSGVAAIVDLGRPEGRVAAAVHRAGTSVVLPAAGATIGATSEYRYLHRSLDEHPPPDVLLRHDRLRLDKVWRMGPLGFVWAAVLRNV